MASSPENSSGQDRWRRLKGLFEDAQGLPADRWEDFLVHECPEDPTLQAEVIRMLRSSSSSDDDFLERPRIRLSGFLDEDSIARSLQVGDVLCDRFHIQELLGSGGMGEVYRAYDSELREEIALKTVRGDTLDMSRHVNLLRREVQQARQVTHPGVCRVYDFFTHTDRAGTQTYFLTMELLHGETLEQHLSRKGPFKVEQALPILEEIAEALSTAHSAGIVHRDLKCSNVFLISDGDLPARVVITDFGLASTIQLATRESTATASNSSLIGTLSYMAPEQLESGVISPQVDVYALGLIAYEMVTGRLPFENDSPLAAVIKRTKAAPPPPSAFVPSVPLRWDLSIQRCLQPNPNDRFRTAREFVDSLGKSHRFGLPLLWNGPARRYASAAVVVLLLLAGVGYLVKTGRIRPDWNQPPAAAPTAIAVLPFENTGGDPANEYLSDGVTEQVINSLGYIGSLRVVSRNSSFAFKRTEADLPTIAQRLDVNLILTGAVSRTPTNVLVTARLVDPLSGRVLWSQSYDRELKNVFSVQDEIAAGLSQSLNFSSRRMQQAGTASKPRDFETFDLFLRGRFQASRRDEAGLRNSLKLFQAAAQRDPGYAAASSEIGNVLLLLGDYGFEPALDVLPPARAAILRALEVDPNLTDAQAVLGQLMALFEWDWPNAEVAFTRAIRSNPNHALARHWYAQFLMKLGRTQEANVHARKSLQLDPVSIPANTFLGWLYFYSRDFANARAQAEKTLELNPYYVHAYVLRSLAEAHLGLRNEARASVMRAAQLSTDQLLGWRYLATTYAALGDRAEAMKYLQQLVRDGGKRQPAFIGFVYAYLDMPDEAFKWFERAYADRDAPLLHLQINPALDRMRKDPRYLELVHKLKFPVG